MNPIARKLLSPGLLWPLFIVALLATSVGMSVYAVVAAHSDGGAATVPDYYSRAAHYEDEAEARAASRALGWQVEVAVEGRQASGLYPLVVTFGSADGLPLPGVEGAVALQRVQDAAPRVTLPLRALGEGRYAADAPFSGRGLWDVHVTTRAPAAFSRTVRVEVR